MKVLLCEDVEALGWLGDIVEVKNGYARNYLLPCGLAIVPNKDNIKKLASAKVARAMDRKATRAKLDSVAEHVTGAEAVLAVKANEQGHLFGSVTEHDIADNLRKQGFEIADNMVRLDGHIKEVGTHEVTLRVAADLTCVISVVVVAQDERVESSDKNSE